MNDKIVVTGSSGFIARHLIPALINAGKTVSGLDIRDPVAEFGDQFTHLRGDVRSRQDVARAFAGAQEVIHLAAAHHDFGIDEAEYFDVNVNGMDVILAECSKIGINRVVFTSSVAVYGSTMSPSDESLQPSPEFAYGKSKLQAEKRLREWASNDSTRTIIIVRPTVVYGEHNRENMYRLIDTIYRGRYVQVGEGENRKSIIYVGNVIAALEFLMAAPQSNEIIVNLADEPAMTSRELAEYIADCLHTKLRSFTIPRWLALPLVSPVDLCARLLRQNLPITRSRIEKYLTESLHSSARIRAMGFVPPFCAEDGVRKVTDWYLSGTADS